MSKLNTFQIGGLTAIVLGFVLTSNLPGADSRPNILWIISEDTGPEMACFGEQLVHTPNIDSLATDGARFNAAFTVTPVCSTSRSSFMTGMYASTIGAHNHRSHRADGFTLPDGVNVITKYFRDGGYHTGIVTRFPGGLRCSGKTDWNFKPHVNPYDTKSWKELVANQPFFAQIQFSETHRSFKGCPKHPVDPDKVKLPPYYPDHPVARKDWAMYLESVNNLDIKVGKVLDQLEKDGLADNTIVIYFGDHGRAMVRGKQWLYDGGIRIPMVVRWPGHIKPGTVVDELVCSLDFAPTFLSLAGIEPPRHLQGRIFLGPHKSPEPQYVFATRDRCDETVDHIRCVRSRKYKYIRNFMPERPYTQQNLYKERQYPMLALMKELHSAGKLTPQAAAFMAPTKPVEELYDIQADPWEVKNLADSADHRDILRKMRARLDQWIEETNDQGRFPESPESRQPARRAKKKKLSRSSSATIPATDVRP